VEALRTRGRTVDNSWIATKQEVDAEEAAQLVATSAETSAAAAAEGHVLQAMMAAQPPQPGKSKPEEVLQLAHKSIDELRGLLKATAYVIASAPTLRAKHEVRAACPSMLPHTWATNGEQASRDERATTVATAAAAAATAAAVAACRAVG
jgi:hypothetical protein